MSYFGDDVWVSLEKIILLPKHIIINAKQHGNLVSGRQQSNKYVDPISAIVETDTHGEKNMPSRKEEIKSSFFVFFQLIQSYRD